MKTTKIKLLSCLVAATAVVGVGLMPHKANAVDQDVQATLQTRVAVSLTLVASMNFGRVDFTAVHGGNITLGTNGTPALAGATGLTISGGTPAAGHVTASGDGASTVDISCETGGTLTDGGANNVTLSAVEIVIGGGVASGAGTACGGLASVSLTNDFSVTATPAIRMGGTIDTTANAIDVGGTYSTASAGGNPVTLRVVYQ